MRLMGMSLLSNMPTCRYVSDLISVHRSLPDIRNDWCRAPERLFNVTLPKVRKSPDYPLPRPVLSSPSTTRPGRPSSAPSTPSSTGASSPWSLRARSPEELLHEIILVDDASDMDHVKGELDRYLAQYPKVS